MNGMPFTQIAATDVDVLREFLGRADLTPSGLDAPTVRLWTERDADGSIVGSTGYELSPDGAHALTGQLDREVAWTRDLADLAERC